MHIHTRFRRQSLLVLLLVVVIFLAQCAPFTRKQEMVPNRPETKVLPARTEVVRTAAERVLISKNFSLDTEKSNSFQLQTEWLKEKNYRSKARVTLKPHGKSRTEVTLYIVLEKKSYFKEEWKPTEKIGEDTYRLMMGDIEMECYRVLYDRP